jgi:hypothetical protein
MIAPARQQAHQPAGTFYDGPNRPDHYLQRPNDEWSQAHRVSHAITLGNDFRQQQHRNRESGGENPHGRVATKVIGNQRSAHRSADCVSDGIDRQNCGDRFFHVSTKFG